MDKTNVMRLLDQKKIPYMPHFYDTAFTDGLSVAEQLHEDPARVFKTLVTAGANGTYYVFVIPVAENLDLKKAAKAVSVKSIDMLPQKQLLPITGYVHGGCSPIGMKKQFRTVLHESAAAYSTICVSAGRLGAQIELSPDDLAAFVRASYADLTASGSPGAFD